MKNLSQTISEGYKKYINEKTFATYFSVKPKEWTRFLDFVRDVEGIEIESGTKSDSAGDYEYINIVDQDEELVKWYVDDEIVFGNISKNAFNKMMRGDAEMAKKFFS